MYIPNQHSKATLDEDYITAFSIGMQFLQYITYSEMSCSIILRDNIKHKSTAGKAAFEKARSRPGCHLVFEIFVQLCHYDVSHRVPPIGLIFFQDPSGRLRSGEQTGVLHDSPDCLFRLDGHLGQSPAVVGGLAFLAQSIERG